MQTRCLSIAKIVFFHDKHSVYNKKTQHIIILDFIFVLLQTIMNIRRLFIFISLAFSCLAQAQHISLETLKRIGLPVVVVETVDAEEPTCEYLTIEDGYPGNTIRNATKVPGRVYVMEGNDTIYDSGNYEEDISGMTIKLRGNSSAVIPDKKPFKIKLQKKADMLGEDEKYNDKNWLLLKEEFPSLNLMVGLKVNELVGLQWTPRFKYVNLLFNGDYRGVYMLCEAVNRNTDCRLDVSKNGFIFELDPYWWNEDVYFQSNVLGYKYTFKYPDAEDVTEEQLQYLIDFMSDVDNALYGNNYEKYIDIESFASWMLGHDILGTYDASGSNIFFTKYDTLHSKLTMANMWDFDTIEMTPDTFSVIHDFDVHFLALFQNPNETFIFAYINRWKELSETLFDDMSQFLDDFGKSPTATALNKSMQMDYRRWETYGPTVAEIIASNKQWFAERKPYLDSAIHYMETTTTIKTPVILPKTNGKTYNLHGMPVQEDKYKGFIIKDGRLRISK